MRILYTFKKWKNKEWNKIIYFFTF